MADSRPERRFTRIDRLPPYVLTSPLNSKWLRVGAAKILLISVWVILMAQPLPHCRKTLHRRAASGYARLFHVPRHTAFTPRDFSLVSGTL